MDCFKRLGADGTAGALDGWVRLRNQVVQGGQLVDVGMELLGPCKGKLYETGDNTSVHIYLSII